MTFPPNQPPPYFSPPQPNGLPTHQPQHGLTKDQKITGVLAPWMAAIATAVVTIPSAFFVGWLQTAGSQQVQEKPAVVGFYLWDAWNQGNMAAVIEDEINIDDLPQEETCPLVGQWAVQQQSGVDHLQSVVRVEAYAAKDRTVMINEIRAVIEEKEPASPAPTIVGCSAEGAGSPRQMGIHLDAPEPRLVRLEQPGILQVEEPFFKDDYLYLENQTPEVMEISVLATEPYRYGWYLEVTGRVDGEETRWEVNNDGELFWTAGLADAIDEYGPFYNWRPTTPSSYETGDVPLFTGLLLCPPSC